jgi:hypothetical protein
MIVELLKVQKAPLRLHTNQTKKRRSTDKVDFTSLNLHPKKGEILVIQMNTGSSITHNTRIKKRFNALYTLLYVWRDFKAQTLIINTDPFSSFF